MKKGLLAAGLALALITPLAQADQAAVDRLREAGFPLTPEAEAEVLAAPADQVGSVLSRLVDQAVRANPAGAGDIVSSAVTAEPGQAAAITAVAVAAVPNQAAAVTSAAVTAAPDAAADIAAAAVGSAPEAADSIRQAAINSAPDQAANIQAASGDAQRESQQTSQTMNQGNANLSGDDVSDNVASDN
ncbi:hypothetical protein [Spiribacter vilamensis]|uniref:Uncharacterized protein n=1 Tax=Spiribacter vilamensis TaxID=531306 RepID=A0A4Q8D1F2_9GAMM|nr:hypothetical protein [Spiribacter vilamensis]RZU99087.1 hypothetical protein EV698_1366 [Spiribacter vilamensis]TVO61916.1 hypothetical protein FPL09_07375 [Spiribacter vilamensis]